MKNKTILTKVIYKAEENGCEICLASWLDYHDESDISYHKHYQIIFSHSFAKAFWGEGHCICKTCGNKYTDKEFDNEKLWIRKDKDEGVITDYVYCIYNRKNNLHFLNIDKKSIKIDWRYHLQQMVLEENPLKYLEKFL